MTDHRRLLARASSEINRLLTKCGEPNDVDHGPSIVHEIDLYLAEPDRVTKLVKAAEEFVRKVECGEARSVRSYAQFKAALEPYKRRQVMDAIKRPVYVHASYAGEDMDGEWNVLSANHKHICHCQHEATANAIRDALNGIDAPDAARRKG